MAVVSSYSCISSKVFPQYIQEIVLETMATRSGMVSNCLLEAADLSLCCKI